MASISVLKSKHTTFTTTTADIVTFLQPWGRVEITNFDGTNKIYYTIDGSTPTAGADNTGVVPVSSSKVFHALVGPGRGGNVITLVGNAGAYSIEGVE